MYDLTDGTHMTLFERIQTGGHRAELRLSRPEGLSVSDETEFLESTAFNSPTR
jgi:hypothetical protein